MNKELNQLIENLKREYEDEVCFTTNIKACYYILPNGKMLSIGYDYGCRSNDHRAIFAGDDSIKDNDWTALHAKYSLVGYCPETNDGWIARDQQVTKEQEKVLNKYNINLITEKF